MPDSDALRALRSEVGDAVVVDRFVADFLELVEVRLARLDDLVHDTRLEAAETLLLSLETSATMIGADELSDAAHTAREELLHELAHTPADLPGSLSQVHRAAERLLAAAAPAPTNSPPTGS